MDNSDRINAPIRCPLKMSTVAWSKCQEYRGEYKCLCKEARDRFKIKGDGREAFEQKLREIKKPRPRFPHDWKYERMSRFYVIYDSTGELRHRATNKAEAEDYLELVAKVQFMEAENKKLWKLLEDELIDVADPWTQVDKHMTKPDEE